MTCIWDSFLLYSFCSCVSTPSQVVSEAYTLGFACGPSSIEGKSPISHDAITFSNKQVMKPQLISVTLIMHTNLEGGIVDDFPIQLGNHHQI